MMATGKRQRRQYATDKQVERAVDLARRCGLDVAGFEVSADGTIRILDARAMSKTPAAPANDFDRFMDQL